MVKKLKVYRYNTLYRSQPICLKFLASTYDEAAKKLNIKLYEAKKYCLKVDAEEHFEGMIASFNSGLLWSKEKALINKEMPFEDLKKIIDKHIDEKYKSFNNGK